MNIDDILALAAQERPSPMEHARARRAVRQLRLEYARRVTANQEITTDVDLRDPLDPGIGDVKRLSRAAELAKLGTVTWDARRSELAWSDEMSMILGFAPGLTRPSLTRLFGLIHPDDRSDVRQRIRDAWRQATVTEVVCRVVRPNRITSYVHCFIEVLVSATGRPYGIIGIAQDHTEVEMTRQENDRLARRYQSVRTDLLDRDPVSGLLTRGRFADEIDRVQRAGTGTLLVISAPPRIRRDVTAATAGTDELTAATAEVLQKLARPADPCGVVGHQEFGVLMPYTTIDTAIPIATEILDGLRSSWFLAGAARLDAYGGLVRYDHRAPTSSTELLIDGEAAWRRAERDGSPLHVLRQSPSAEERRTTLRDRIQTAVAGNRFALYAQPLWDLELNQVTRHEVLLRVLDDSGRAIPPSTFLDLAEHVDEILPVDKWVIEHAMRLVGQGSQTSHYQVNVSGRSLADPHLLDHLRDAIRRHRVNPECVTLEITETALIGNMTEALRFAEGVREIGCQLALDDFGAGYASFRYLKYFPIDLVKIDGDFIRDLPRSATDQAIVRSLVQVCRDLGIRTAAEFVQDEASLSLLRSYGVDFAQGYHIGRPELVSTDSHGPAAVEQELYGYVVGERTAM